MIINPFRSSFQKNSRVSILVIPAVSSKFLFLSVPVICLPVFRGPGDRIQTIPGATLRRIEFFLRRLAAFANWHVLIHLNHSFLYECVLSLYSSDVVSTGIIHALSIFLPTDTHTVHTQSSRYLHKIMSASEYTEIQ